MAECLWANVSVFDAARAEHVDQLLKDLAVAFAIAKGDMKRVQELYTGPAIDGIVNINPLQ